MVKKKKQDEAKKMIADDTEVRTRLYMHVQSTKQLTEPPYWHQPNCQRPYQQPYHQQCNQHLFTHPRHEATFMCTYYNFLRNLHMQCRTHHMSTNIKAAKAAAAAEVLSASNAPTKVRISFCA